MVMVMVMVRVMVVVMVTAAELAKSWIGVKLENMGNVENGGLRSSN